MTLFDKTDTKAAEKAKLDRQEFEELVHRHHASAFNVAYRITGNRDDAADLAQETFLRAFRFFGNYRREMPFESWLYKIMSNLWIDTIRRRPKSGIPLSLDQTIGDSEQTIDLPGDDPTPEESYLQRTLDSRIQAALEALSPDFRLAVILADIEGMSYEEIAEIMNCPIGTVRSRIHRGRVEMRNKLGSIDRLLSEDK